MKKIISVLLCFCLITGMVPSVFAYEASEALTLLRSMGIVQGDPDGNLRPADNVKRSEFAKMAVLLSAYKDNVSLNSKISVFADCGASHWAAPYVKVAAENGIIQGYSNGRFGPDDNITYAQAVTIALRLLGYSDEDFGFSYPEGQLGMAISLKLNQGVSKSADDILSRGDVAVILANMLSTSSKDGTTDYIESLGYSIEEELIIVASNDEDAAVTPGKVYTSNGEYSISESFDKSLIGSKGRALIDSEGRLVSVLESNITSHKYAVYTAGSDLVTVHGADGSMTLDCDDGTLCYSGIQKTTFGSVKSALSIGDILSIGKDKYGNIDYIIAGESDFEGPYTVAEDGAIPADVNFENYVFVKNGSRSSLGEIKKHDIVYYSPSLDTVFSYSKKVSGVYTSAIPNIDSPQKVVVGGKEYAIESPLAFSKLASGGVCSIGDTVVLLIGRDGGVADIMDDSNITTGLYTPNPVLEADGIPSALAVLSEVGAINTQTYPSDSNTALTRGEFAKMVVMSSPYRNMVSLGSKISLFSDCPSTYHATPYIKVAVEKGMMSAYSDAKFHPDEAVTFAQALDACLKILGYQDSDFSAWPSSQISIAGTKGISEGIYKSANDAITASEAITILYNTLCATNKQGNMKGIESIGYEYYEDAVLIATNKENSSVPSGKILTSAGTFSIDDAVYSADDLGKSVELLIYSGKIQKINKKPYYYAENIIYSAVPGGIAVTDGNNVLNMSVSDNTSVYIDASLKNFGAVKSEIAVGDSMSLCYDEAQRLKYIYLAASSLAGPYIVKNPSAWYTGISGASPTSKIMKNGSEISSGELSVNDILYYSPSLGTAFAYNERIIGILEGASPAKDTPNSVTVSGTSYTIETADVSFADVNYGDTLIVCLGRNGKVAYSYPASQTELAGYLVSTGTKEFINKDGDMLMSPYASLILADGSELQCATGMDYKYHIGSVMCIEFNGGSANLVRCSAPGTVTGVADSGEMRIGNASLSGSVKILDVACTSLNEVAVYKSIYPVDIEGRSIRENDVLYAKQENGYITELIMNNVTGDAFSYGLVTEASTRIGEMSSSGSYTCLIGRDTCSYSGSAYTGISKGNVVRVARSGSRIDGFAKLSSQYVNVKDISYNSIIADDGSKHTLSGEVNVYMVTSAYSYTYIPLSLLIENPKAYSQYAIYYDRPESEGGKVRVIIVR